MAYDKQTWSEGVAGGTPLNPTRLNHMETGIDDAHTLISDLAAATHTHTSADITDATDVNTVNTLVKRGATGFIAVSGITGLSTATGLTQAVPKSQLDEGLAGKSNTSHTHDYSATGHTHTAANVTDFNAAVESEVSTLLVQGENVILDYDALAGTLTINSAASGLTSVTYADLPAGTTVTVLKSGGVWPARPTARADLIVAWKGADPDPAIVASGTGGMHDGIDYRLVTP